MPSYGPPLALLKEAPHSMAGLGPPNPACRCPDLIASLFCQTGHMLECHYPMSCKEAQCSHYQASLLEETDR